MIAAPVMNPRLAVTSLVSLCCAACDSGGSAKTPAVVQPSVAITEENAVEVAGAAYGMFDLVRIARIAATFLATPPPEPPAVAVSPGVVVQTLSGPQGGEGVFTWIDHDSDTRYSTGDSFAISLAAYADGGLELTGAIVFDGVVTVGDVLEGFAWTITARIGFVSLRVVAEGFETTLNGSMLFEREKRATVTLLTLDADSDIAYGGRMLQAGSMLARNEYLIDFSMALFADATLEDPVLGGVLRFSTDTPLTGVQVMPDPWAGSLRVEGGNASVMDVAAVDLMNAELQVDLEGDEVIDVLVPVAWVEI